MRAALDEAGAVGLHSASPSDDVARRAERAAHLARLGALSAAKQAPIAEPLRELTDPERRPRHRYRSLPPDLLNFQPDAPVALDRAALITNLCHARKGSAPGRSGYTRPNCSAFFARAKVPAPIAAAISLGRLVALRKPSGGARGLVVGDLLRRLVARTLAQQFSQQLNAACHPHLYALSTRTGAEALVHTLQAKTQADPHLTVLSVDISAPYDTASREAMLSALREVPQASALMPFVRLWYARESVYIWAAGSQAHRITQAEGGEQARSHFGSSHGKLKPSGSMQSRICSCPPSPWYGPCLQPSDSGAGMAIRWLAHHYNLQLPCRQRAAKAWRMRH